MRNNVNPRANTSGNVIAVTGDITKREAVLNGAGTLTPGCLVIPFTGVASEGVGIDGSTGSVQAAAAGNTRVAVLDVTSTEGMPLDSEYVEGDQVPVLYPAKGHIVRVRIASDSDVTQNTPLIAAANGFVASGTLAAAIGIAREDIPIGDPDLPTFIMMEVL
ncbi:MAG: hypothetical protein FWB96_01255 [Defluviitaleaceae bacterium]|nr:hypothetical protein [Defluviitaleaceae bacterium]MCL2261680.1 hypothetical protein [Defluviitaleaceae bacterium]